MTQIWSNPNLRQTCSHNYELTYNYWKFTIKPWLSLNAPQTMMHWYSLSPALNKHHIVSPFCDHFDEELFSLFFNTQPFDGSVPATWMIEGDESQH